MNQRQNDADPRHGDKHGENQDVNANQHPDGQFRQPHVDSGTGPVYGSAGPRGTAPVPPPPPPGYAAPGYQPGDDGPLTQYTPIIPGQVTEDESGYSHGGHRTMSGQDDLDRPSSMGGPNPWAQQGQVNQPPPPQLNPPQHNPPPYNPQQYNAPQYGQPGQNPPPSPPPENQSQPHPGPVTPPPGAPLTKKEVNQWAAGAHAGGLLAWIPVVPLVPAIAIYAVYKDRSPYIREQALEAINFQICILIAHVAASLIDALPILDNFTLLVWAISAVFATIGAVAALRGDRYRYPFTRHFIK